MLGDLPGAQSVATPRKQGQHLGLCRIDSGRTAGGPEFGTKHQCNALETFNEPGRDRVGNRSVIHKEWIGLLTNGVNIILRSRQCGLCWGGKYPSPLRSRNVEAAGEPNEFKSAGTHLKFHQPGASEWNCYIRALPEAGSTRRERPAHRPYPQLRR